MDVLRLIYRFEVAQAKLDDAVNKGRLNFKKIDRRTRKRDRARENLRRAIFPELVR